MNKPMTYEQALAKCEETSKLNGGRKFVPAKVTYNATNEEGWDVTPAKTKINKASLVDSIDQATSTAYMRDDYGTSWKQCIRLLLTYGLSPKQVEAILLSKHMRWADDSEGKGNGNKTNSAAFERYLTSWMMVKGAQAWQVEIEQLTSETFGA